MFLEKWHNKYKDTKYPWPTDPVGYIYNGCMFLFEAVKKAKSIDPEAVAKVWEGMEFEGVMGKIPCGLAIIRPGALRHF